MNSKYDIFGSTETSSEVNPYEVIGFSRNPFRTRIGDEETGRAPFYGGHIRTQLAEIQKWLKDVHEGENNQPLSLVGNIGAGKTRILRLLQLALERWPANERVAVHTVLLSDSGFSRASVGAMLVQGLEQQMEHLVGSVGKPPENVLPIVWAVVKENKYDESARGLLPAALRKASSAAGDEQQELAEDISRWICRLPLTPARSRRVGLPRAIDWEGELVRIFAQLLRIAKGSGVIQTFFFFVDQIEELFRPTFSDLRRSRILTDFRSLVDDIDYGAPVGLLLAWTPESDERLQKKYEALLGRLRRRRVALPLLKHGDAIPFAQTWSNAAKLDPNAPDKVDIRQIVQEAWKTLAQEGDLLPPGITTPRDLLRVLAMIVDHHAGVAKPS